MPSDRLPGLLSDLASAAADGDRSAAAAALDEVDREFERVDGAEDVSLARATAALHRAEPDGEDRAALDEYVGTLSTVGLSRASLLTTGGLFVSHADRADPVELQRAATALADLERRLLELAGPVEAVVDRVDLPPVLDPVPVEVPDEPVREGATVELRFAVRNLGDRAATGVALSTASDLDVTPDSMTEDSLDPGGSFDAVFGVTADATGTFAVHLDCAADDATGGTRRVEVEVEEADAVDEADVAAWSPVYRGLAGRFRRAFEDAKAAWPPGEFDEVLETGTFPTADVLAPVDLAAVYGAESAFGTDPTAYDGSRTARFGGFQLDRRVGERYGLAVTDEAGTDGRVEWRGDLLRAARAGRLEPAWYGMDDLDPFDDLRLEPVATVAAQHLFDGLRALVAGSFEDQVGEWLRDEDPPVEIPAGEPGLQLAGAVATDRPGDDRWRRFAPGDDRPRGETAAYEGLLRQTIRFGGLDETVADLQEGVETASALKADPGVFEPAVDREAVAEVVSQFESWLAGRVGEYLEHFLLGGSGLGAEVADGSALRAASRDEATAEDLRRLTHAGYATGVRRVLLARFKAHLWDVAEGHEGLQGYPCKWEHVGPFLGDEAAESVEETALVRELLAEEPPTGAAKLTAVDFEGAEERVALANTGEAPVAIGGWRLRDSDGNEVVFDEGVVLAGTMTVELDDEDALDPAVGAPFLNDDGDRVELVADRDGRVVSAFEYRVDRVPVVEANESLTVFGNAAGDSDVTHLAEWDCGHRPPPERRTEPFAGTPTCGHCLALEQRNVAVRQEWTVPDDGETGHETSERTLRDVEPGRFFGTW